MVRDDQVIIEDVYEPSPLLERFEWKQLPLPMATVAMPYYDVAIDMDRYLPACPEKETALRKLLESRNAATRAVFNKEHE